MLYKCSINDQRDVDAKTKKISKNINTIDIIPKKAGICVCLFVFVCVCMC